MKHTRRSALLGFIACLTGVGVAKKRPTQPIGLSMKQMDQFMDHLEARGIFKSKDLRAEKFCILTGPIHVVPAQIENPGSEVLRRRKQNSFFQVPNPHDRTSPNWGR